MEPEEEEYKREDHLALVIILVLAFLAVASLFVAFSYYCYIRNKVSKRLRDDKKSESFSFTRTLLFFKISLFLIYTQFSLLVFIKTQDFIKVFYFYFLACLPSLSFLRKWEKWVRDEIWILYFWVL